MTSADEPWPALDFETLEWQNRYAEHGPRASRIARISEPYRAALPPTIARRGMRLAGNVAVLADEASTALARFDVSLGSEVAPFAALLLRSEAAA